MRSKGFTLIEMLITVAILAILAAIAVPSYQQFILKSRRSDGMSALLKLQLEQEKFRANCRFYAEKLGTADSCGADAANSALNFSDTSEDGYYTIAVTAASGNGYTITADPVGRQAVDTDCDPLKYEYPAGIKSPADCWD
ncbi:type IV pilin protein [uncultured Microbulbifer sp.]|uniref:type IV pilin protein n=1 Tax=uncultured Microbulbifer sp. TaxID=348147 RepID=UPI0025DCC94C|nr:type IV pilin protein [uncultured Microbulbifer sp.]